MTEFFEFQSRTKILSGRGALLHLGSRNSPAWRQPCNPDFRRDAETSGDDRPYRRRPSGRRNRGTDRLYRDSYRLLSVHSQQNRRYLPKNDIDMIIGLGGGSVIDTAKGVRMILSQNSDDILKLSGYEGLPAGSPVPLCIIPPHREPVPKSPG